LQLVLVFRQALFRAAKGANHLGHGFGRLQGIGARALQLEKDLAVWKAALEPVRHYQSQGGLADAASSPQPGDGCTSIKGLQDYFQLFSSADEILWRRRCSWNRQLLPLDDVGLVDRPYGATKVYCIPCSRCHRTIDLTGKHRSLNASGNVCLRALDNLAALVVLRHCALLIAFDLQSLSVYDLCLTRFAVYPAPIDEPFNEEFINRNW